MVYMDATDTTVFLANLFIFIGKAGIIAANVAIFELCLEHVTKENAELTSQIGPMIVVGVITYIFASMFIGMYDESAYALLLSVAIDTNANDG